MMDAPLNAQSQTASVAFGPDGTADLRLSLVAGQPSRGAAPGSPGAVGGVKIILGSGDGSADAFSLADLSSDEVADAPIGQAGKRTLREVRNGNAGRRRLGPLRASGQRRRWIQTIFGAWALLDPASALHIHCGPGRQVRRPQKARLRRC